MDLTVPYTLENFIGGKFIPPLSEKFLDNFNPATGQVYGKIPESDEADVQIAVEEAPGLCLNGL
jgi:aminomuconate-semialdehyde/2-hydroxymuconate-6-semialdehyde dehydrogenase